MPSVRIKVLKNIPDHQAGTLVNVKTDELGNPLDRFWRRRFEDAKIDDCISIYVDGTLEIVKPVEDTETKPKITKRKKSKQE